MKSSQRRDSRWHARRRAERVIHERNGVAVVSLGQANVWDFGDLVRLREVASGLISEGQRRIGIDLSHVGYLPSGFMNMLCEWQERGLDVFLFDPRPNVRDMLWFQRFTEPAGTNAFRITCSPPEETWWRNGDGSVSVAGPTANCSTSGY
jgi:hypothetical protein